MATHNFNWNRSTGVLLLDIGKAFDKVWHRGLVYKLFKLQFPAYLCRTVSSFLRGRSFQVTVGGEMSTSRVLTAGVPQGSLLSPLLYTLYTHDMPKTPGTMRCQYADDTAILVTGYRPKRIVKSLQIAATSLETYFDTWRIEVNGAKSKALLLSRRMRKPGIIPRVKLCGEEVPWVYSAKYLGVILDRRLSWVENAKSLRCKAAMCRRTLEPLICNRSRLSIRNKLRLYTSVVRPTMTYAAPIWAFGASQSTLRSLETAQSTVLRMIVDAPYYVSNDRIRTDLRIPPLVDYLKSTTLKFLLRAEHHDNPLVSGVCQYEITPIMAHKRPRWVLEADGWLDFLEI